MRRGRPKAGGGVDVVTGFNEAEARVPRKTSPIPGNRSLNWTCFNEAEARVPRKTRIGRRDAANVHLLQ